MTSSPRPRPFLEFEMPHAREETDRPAVTVNSLPDTIFLEIFAFCISRLSSGFGDDWHTTAWQRLVQVCQRWQQIIYGSPRYLDLHHYCSCQTPFRKNFSRWPEFPLNLAYAITYNDEVVDDLIAALEQPDRVHSINLSMPILDARVDDVLEKMKVPFPALTHLFLRGPDPDDCNIEDHQGIVLPRKFLGKSAPNLQHLYFEAVNAFSFQILPKLLLSSRGLVSLELEDIPPNYYNLRNISPMAGGLAGLTRLSTLSIGFRFPLDPSDSNVGFEMGTLPEPRTRAALPALTKFLFSGESYYLEDLVARIDMPSIEVIKIDYFSPPEVEVGQLSQFIGRTANLDFAQFRRAQVDFEVHTTNSQWEIKLNRPQGERRRQVRFSLGVKTSGYPELDDLVTCMARVLGHLTALLSNVGHLSFKELQRWNVGRNRLDSSKLLPLLHLFPAVKALRVSGVLAGHIATVLDNIAEERVTEVMPALRSLQLGDGNELAGSTERFLSLRQLSGHPVAVVNNAQDKVNQR